MSQTPSPHRPSRRFDGARRRTLAAAALALGLLPFASSASAQDAGLEGAWRISIPSSAFTPLDGPIPFTPAGKKIYQQNKAALAKGDFSFDRTQSRCASPGATRLALTPMRFRIWARPRFTLFQYEWNRLYRAVDMTGRKADDPLVGPAIGVSEGQWEGKTLVVKSRLSDDATLIDDLTPHDGDMTVEERWSLTGPDTLRNQITITNPAFFTRPWRTEVTYQRQPDVAFTEDVCLDRRDAGQLPLPRPRRR
jgi:hypothetical protein